MFIIMLTIMLRLDLICPITAAQFPERSHSGMRRRIFPRVHRNVENMYRNLKTFLGICSKKLYSISIIDVAVIHRTANRLNTRHTPFCACSNIGQPIGAVIYHRPNATNGLSRWEDWWRQRPATNPDATRIDCTPLQQF